MTPPGCILAPRRSSGAPSPYTRFVFPKSMLHSRYRLPPSWRPPIAAISNVSFTGMITGINSRGTSQGELRGRYWSTSHPFQYQGGSGMRLASSLVRIFCAQSKQRDNAVSTSNANRDPTPIRHNFSALPSSLPLTKTTQNSVHTRLIKKTSSGGKRWARVRWLTAAALNWTLSLPMSHSFKRFSTKLTRCRSSLLRFMPRPFHRFNKEENNIFEGGLPHRRITRCTT